MNIKKAITLICLFIFVSMILTAFTNTSPDHSKTSSLKLAKKNNSIEVPIGLYQSSKKTNEIYKTVTWKTLELNEDGQAVWIWHMDFENSTLRYDSDTCFWEKDVFKMSYTVMEDGTLELECSDKKKKYCDGRVKQRSCFDFNISVRLTEEGLYVDNGDNDGLYKKQ